MLSHDHGSTAIAGITYYAADHFPAAYRDRIFIGNVVTNRINHDRLVRHGSTLRAIEQPDFLSSDDPWFRPVDIKLGPDGALYVADFYNRIIGHYEVPLTHPGRDRQRGRIWRISYRGTDASASPRQPRPDWGKATMPELVHDLGHANLTVRLLAMEQLIERGSASGKSAARQLMTNSPLSPSAKGDGSRSSPLSLPGRGDGGGGSTPFQRMHGLWVLERQGALDDSTLAAAISDPAPGVRVHAMRVLAERGGISASLHSLIVGRLTDSDAFVERTAAEALGTHPDPANIRPLLDLRHRVPSDDTHLLHMVRMALREQLRPATAWQKLPTTAWTERDARAIADVATGVPSAEAARYLLTHLEHFPEPRANQLRYVYHVARYGAGDSGAELLHFARGDRAAALQHKAGLLKAIFEGNQARGASLSTAASGWGEDLVRQLLASSQESDWLLGMELGGLLKIKKTQAYVTALALDKKASRAVRESALAMLVSTEPASQVRILGRVLADTSEPMGLRLKAAQLLAGMNRTESQIELLTSLTTAPQQLAVSIATGLAATPRGAEKFLEAVSKGKASAQLVQERQVAVRLDQTHLPGLKDRVASLTRGLPSPDKRIQDLMANRRKSFLAAKSSAEQGVKVFEKFCANCHQVANRGAKIGPQLDGIGIRGLDRLLEDVLDPSRNVDQAFRLTTLGLNSGQIVSGLLLREEGQVLVLADNQGKEVRVAKSDVEDRTLSQLSPMPANLVDQIPEADFNHLLAYLLAQQVPKTKDRPDASRQLGH
jgi:putative heme-binding domain-containing protein